MGNRTLRHQVGLATAALAMGAVGVGVSTPSQAAGTAADAAPQADRHAAVIADALRALAARPGVARATQEQKFQVADVVLDKDGSSHVRMTRTVHGLPVIGGDIVVHESKAGALTGSSQTLKVPLDLAVEPSVTKVRATASALAPSKITDAIEGLKADGVPSLVIDAISPKARLAWQITSRGRQADGTPSRLVTLVDAKTGKVIRREEQIQTADGNGNSLYSGSVGISVSQSGSRYTLTDVAHGSAKTTDMQNKEDSLVCTLLGIGCTNGVAYSSPDNSFGTGSNSNRESAAVDAHYGGAVTFDYYKFVLGRNGIFGNGTGAPSRVHYGKNYINAFWDGEKMTYGDGNGTTFGPLVSLDVAGHEMSHGVTENTAGLAYSGESGGLNEATSDIFGTMVEFYAANPNDPADYYIGEEFDLASHEGFRRMDDPAKDGDSQSCFTSGTKDLDVHFSSGVGNHFYYLLAEGSGAKNIGGKAHNSPTCNGSTITGIGRSAAERIWFRALTVYMTSNTNYAGARAATISAATDLFGASSTQASTVAAAWSAVAVN